MGKISSLLNISNLKKFKKRLDPRLYNGAIFIGLDTVVKSHGGTDFIGFSNSLVYITELSKNLIDKLKKISNNRINLTKKDLVNSVYMKFVFYKKISENLIDEFFSLIVENLKKEKKLKIAKFGTFSIRKKKQRIGRNPKTKEEKNISERNVVLFKPSKEFKELVNFKKDG